VSCLCEWSLSLRTWLLAFRTAGSAWQVSLSWS